MLFFNWFLHFVAMELLMLWGADEMKKHIKQNPNWNRLMNDATGFEQLCPFKSHTAVVCPFMQLRGESAPPARFTSIHLSLKRLGAKRRYC